MHTLMNALGFPFTSITRTSRPIKSAVTVPAEGMSPIGMSGCFIVDPSLGCSGSPNRLVAKSSSRPVGLQRFEGLLCLLRTIELRDDHLAIDRDASVDGPRVVVDLDDVAIEVFAEQDLWTKLSALIHGSMSCLMP